MDAAEHKARKKQVEEDLDDDSIMKYHYFYDKMREQMSSGQKSLLTRLKNDQQRLIDKDPEAVAKWQALQDFMHVTKDEKFSAAAND